MNNMKQVVSAVMLATLIVALASCGEKKKSQDIIAPRIVKAEPQAPSPATRCPW